MLKVRWVNGSAFAHYADWECYRSGFHDVTYAEGHAEKSCELYRNIPALRVQSRRVLDEWPITSAVHISQNRNHRAWMGHAACFLSHGAGMHSSVAAYWMLDQSGRDGANACVMETVELWKRAHRTYLLKEPSRDASEQLAFQFSMPQGIELP